MGRTEAVITQSVHQCNFNIGDTIEIAQSIKEGEKERTQMFAGFVLAMHKNGIASTFTVRKIGANKIGVEKIFPY